VNPKFYECQINKAFGTPVCVINGMKWIDVGEMVEVIVFGGMVWIILK